MQVKILYFPPSSANSFGIPSYVLAVEDRWLPLGVCSPSGFPTLRGALRAARDFCKLSPLYQEFIIKNDFIKIPEWWRFPVVARFPPKAPHTVLVGYKN